MILAKLYRLIRRREPPYYWNYSICLMVWKVLRKTLNVVIVPFVPFNSVRVLLYRLVGYKIGKGLFIGMRCYMDDVDPGLITIGNRVTISYCCKFAVHGRDQKHTPIVIKDYAYIGLGAMFLSGKEGITIGEGAIIGAGAVVNKSIPDYKVAAGVPARILGDAPRRESGAIDPRLYRDLDTVSREDVAPSSSPSKQTESPD